MLASSSDQSRPSLADEGGHWELRRTGEGGGGAAAQLGDVMG